MRYVVGPDVLARSRFAISPLAEVWGELMARTAQVQRHSSRDHDEAFRAWMNSVPTDAPLRRGLVHLVSSTKWLPDFVGITPPARGTPSLEDELALVAGWDDASYRETVRDAARQSWLDQPLEWIESDDLGRRTATALAQAWTILVEPTWPRRRGILDREIAYRSTLLAESGWAAALEGMTRHLQWREPNLLFTSPRITDERTVTSHVVFVPTTQSLGWWCCDGPVGVGLVYGARGTGASSDRKIGDALEHLIGRGRANVLAALDRPATPSQLAGELGASVGTVGAHLGILREAGLVTRARRSRAVYYARTALGSALVAGSSSPSPAVPFSPERTN